VTDYEGGEKTLELDRESVTDGTRALVVDDWVETGGHLRATVDLLERAGATVAAVTVLRVVPGDVPDLSDDCPVHAVGRG
jgi:adenine phosphoribosyltransferase